MKLNYGVLNLVVLLSVILMFFSYVVIFVRDWHKTKVLGAQVSADVVIVSPSVIPTPSPSPSPVPKYTGYCLTVSVLMYHHIEPMADAVALGHAHLTVDVNTFDSQMKYLISEGYTVVSASDLVDALVNRKLLSGKTVVITIDDGYSDVFDYAFPVLQKYNVHADLMISTGLLENQGYLTWGQLEQMVQGGLVYAHDHTWSHYSLPNGSDEKVLYEVMTAKRQLEDHLGTGQRLFAYPYGSVSNRVIKILIDNGFVGAFSTVGGTVQCDSFIMSLHRVRVGNSSLSAYGIY